MKEFLGNISIALNWLTGGRPWTPLCARWAEARVTCRFCRLACRLLDTLYETNHCDRMARKYRRGR